MELSLRLDTLGMLEMHYIRGRERYRDWPQFQMLAASRQARIMAYLSREVAEELHQQILTVEESVGLAVEDEDEDDESGSSEIRGSEELKPTTPPKPAEREGSTFSPSFAQALERLNELARQRLPEGTANPATSTGELSEIPDSDALVGDEEDALEQLQDAFIQMMEVVRELAEELSTDALKVTGRFRCARTSIEFIQAEVDEDDEDEDGELVRDDDGLLELEVELVMVLRLFEEGRSKPDDLPAVELQLDVEDFERLHSTLDIALEQERRSRRRR